MPKHGSFAHLLHSLSHLHLLPKHGSRTSLRSEQHNDGSGAAANAEHDEQREPVRARRFDTQHHHGARHGGGASELRKSKSHQEFGTVYKHAVHERRAQDEEPQRAGGPSFSLGGAQLSPRAQPTTTEAADTGFEMGHLNGSAEVETPDVDARHVQFEDTPSQSSTHRRQAPHD